MNENEMVGMDVFYTGDIANIEGWGAVTDKEDDKWGLRYTVTMKDGRVFRGLYPSMFEKSVGQRFKLEGQVKQEKAERLKQFEALYGENKKNAQ